MRIIFFLISFFSFLNVFSQQENNFLNLEVLSFEESKRVVRRNFTKDDTLYSGVLINELDSVVNNRGSSLQLFFYNKGNLKRQSKFYNNGQMLETIIIDSSGNDSIFYSWYYNGKLKTEINYSKEGGFDSFHEWYENGNLSMEIIYDGKLGISREWYENGQLKKESDVEWPLGNVHSYRKEWCSNGYLIEFSRINQGKQSYHRYNCDSVIIGKGTWIDFGLFWVGRKTEWYDDGTMASEWYFKDGNSRDEANIRHGVWKDWDRKGNLIRMRVFENNKLIEEENYLPSKSKTN